MDFPLISLLDDEQSLMWLQRHFHPDGLHCIQCGVSVDEARPFGTTKQSQVPVYRCKRCQSTYTLYTGTVFQGTHFRPAQVVLLLRGVFKGEAAQSLARELKISRMRAHHYRHVLQANVLRQQPQTPLPDAVTETDELYQHAGEKRRQTRSTH
jgi:hypothetical protein